MTDILELMTLLNAGLLCVSLGAVGKAVLSVHHEGGLTQPLKQFYQCLADRSWHSMTAGTPVNWHTPIDSVCVCVCVNDGNQMDECVCVCEYNAINPCEY